MGGGGWGVGERGGDELSLGSHLALSCCFGGMALSPLLDGGKSMATLWQGGKTWRLLGTGGKSWSWLCIIVCTLQPGLVQPLAEAEYISNNLEFENILVTFASLL